MKVCILSDSHDRGPLMAAAVAAAMADGAEAVIHCGDIIGGNTLKASLKLGLPIHAVHGNNLGDCVTNVLQLQADHHGTRSSALTETLGNKAPEQDDDYHGPLVI